MWKRSFLKKRKKRITLCLHIISSVPSSPLSFLSIYFSFLTFLLIFSNPGKSIKSQFALTSISRKNKTKQKNSNSCKRLQHTAPLFCSLRSWVPFWWNILTCTEWSRLYILDQPRLLKHWSEECCGAFWSYLPPTSLPKKNNGAGLLTVPKSAASLSMFFLSHWRCTCCTVTCYMMRLCILECVCRFIFAVCAQLRSEQMSTEWSVGLPVF